LEVVRAQSRVRYRLDPMFTTLEGELAEIYALVQAMQEAVFAAGGPRGGAVVQIDERRDPARRLGDKGAPGEEVPRGAARRPGCHAGGTTDKALSGPGSLSRLRFTWFVNRELLEYASSSSTVDPISARTRCRPNALGRSRSSSRA